MKLQVSSFELAMNTVLRCLPGFSTPPTTTILSPARVAEVAMYEASLLL